MGEKIKAFEALLIYALSRYKSEFEDAAPDCPYETRMSGTRALLQELSWFVYEWKNPRTGTTILEEFVQKRLLGGGGGKGSGLAARLLLRKNITYDEFLVLGSKGRNDTGGDGEARHTIRVRAQGTKQEYDISAPRHSAGLAKGDRFVGRIHPRGDGTYMVCGVLTRPGEWDGFKEDEWDGFKEDEWDEGREVMAGIREELLAQNPHLSDVISAKMPEIVDNTDRIRPKSRWGPGRRDGRYDGRSMRGAGPDGGRPARSLDEIMSSEWMQNISSDRKKEDAAFDAAMSTPIRTGSKIKPILAGYPDHLLGMMCQETGIKSLPLRRMMIERLAEELPDMVCDRLYGMSNNEQYALAHILRSGFVPYPQSNGELARMLDYDIMGDGSDDAVAFLQIYAYQGLLVVGTATIKGRRQKVAAVASDIRKRILECPGWSEYIKSDGSVRTVKSRMDTW